MFWAFSSWKFLNLIKNYEKIVSMLNILSFFLYTLWPSCLKIAFASFDAQRFELFLYKRVDYDGGYGFQYTFQCSTFWTFSLCSGIWANAIRIQPVSILNVLSFFFIILTMKLNTRWLRFDAQYFKLFLYNSLWLY